MRHSAPRARHSAQRLGNRTRIVALQRLCEIGGDRRNSAASYGLVLIARRIWWETRRMAYSPLSSVYGRTRLTAKRLYISFLRFDPLGRERLRSLDVVRLRTLIAAAKQQDQPLSALDVIDPLAGTEIDLHLDDAGAHTSRLARVSIFQPIDPHENLRATLLVPQAAQPRSEFFSATNLHRTQSVRFLYSVIHRLH